MWAAAGIALKKQVHLRGRRPGVAAPPASPASGIAPWNPDSMWSDEGMSGAHA